MSILRDFRRGWLLILALFAIVPLLHGQAAKPDKTVRIKVLCDADSLIDVEGERTKTTGTERIFVSPDLEPGKRYVYHIKVTWTERDQPHRYTAKVSVEPGKEATVDMRVATLRAKVPDVIYVGTFPNIVNKMLEMAKVGKNDVVFDLGCGDGRILIAAAKKFGCKGVGIDIDPDRIEECHENAKKEGVENLVEFRLGDIFKNIDDLNKASVVTLYLLPELNRKLNPILRKTLKPGSRVVTHNYTMGDDWKSIESAELPGDDGEQHYVYLYKVGQEKGKEKPKKEDKKDDKKDDKPKKEDKKDDKKDDKPKKEDKKDEKKEEARKVETPASIEEEIERLRAQLKDKDPNSPEGKRLKELVEKRVQELKKLDVQYVPTPQAVVDKMLDMAKVKKGDLMYDLGCGDGRLCVTAAKKYEAQAVGFDIDPERVKDSLENVKKNDVGKLVTIEKKDIFTVDLSKVDVLTLYLLPDLNVKLLPQIEKMKPGSRIVSHDFPIRGIKPNAHIKMKAKDDDGEEDEHEIFLFITPLQRAKE
jgi:uncharacterized protein (TIGR03000 family)